MLLVSFGPHWICQWLVLTLVVLPLLFYARRCCRWPLLPTGFVGPTGVAALFFGARWFCRLCFCCSLVLPQFLCGPVVLPLLVCCPTGFAACLFVGPPAGFATDFGNIEQRQDLIILPFTLTLYPLRHGRARGGELARHEAAALAADTAAVFLVFAAMWVRCWCLRAYKCTMFGLSGTIVGLS